MTSSSATIVAALDNSRSSRSAFKQALTLAFARRVGVVAVTVTPRYEGNMSRLSFDDSEESLSKPFLDVLEDAAAYAASLGCPIRTEHRVGVPSAEVVSLAEREGASMIVIGGSPRTQMQRVMLGRTMARIIAEAPCDVLVVPEGAEIRFGKILVGINGSEASRSAGRTALSLATDYGSTVYALAAVDVPVDRTLLYGVLQDAENKKRKVLRDFAEVAEKSGVRPVCDLRRDTVDRALLDYAEDKGLDLIVIGSSEKAAGVGGVLSGSVVERVISRATCPVLAVRFDGAEESVRQ